MATKNFTQFSTTTLTSGDYIVGYKEDGSAEFRSPVQDIINLVQDSDNQTLSFNEASKNLTISSGNTVSLSALVDSSIDTGVRGLTGNWEDTYNTVQTNSASWEESADITAITTTVAFNSGNWNQGYDVATIYQEASGFWQDTSTSVQTNSANWNYGYDVATYVQTNSASWEESADITAITTTVAFNSGNWNTAYETATVYQTNSATYATNTLLDSVSSQLVPKTDFDSYKTDVAATTATLITNTLGDSRYNPKTIIGTITTPFSQTNTNALDDLLETAVSLEANKTYLVFGTVATTNSPTGLANGCKIMLFSNNTSDDSHTICQIVVHGAINGSGGSVRVSTNFSGSLFNTPHVTPTGAANAEISNSFQGIIRPSINCDMRVRIAPNNVADEALVTKAGSSLVVIPIDF